MRLIRSAGSLVVMTILLTASTPAQERADLSGNWVGGPNGQRLVIKQDAAQLTVTDGRGRVLVYRLDASESRNETTTVTGEKWTHVSQAKWVSSALVVTTKTTRAAGQNWDWMTIYRRDGQGNLLVTTLDAVTDPGPFMAMSMLTVEYQKEPTPPLIVVSGDGYVGLDRSRFAHARGTKAGEAASVRKRATEVR